MPQNLSLQVIDFIFCQILSHHHKFMKKIKIKNQTFVNNLKNVGWYVTLTIIKVGILCGINQIIWMMLYFPMSICACMQQIHLLSIKYLTLFMPNKQNLEILPTTSTPHLKIHTKISKISPTTWCPSQLNSWDEGINNPLESPPEFKRTPSHAATKNTSFCHHTHSWSTQHIALSQSLITIGITCNMRQYYFYIVMLSKPNLGSHMSSWW